MPLLHKTITSGRWNELSFAERMGNIGSEISRVRSADERRDIERRDNAIARALELVDVTIAQQTGARKRELEQMRDALCAIRGNADGAVSARSLERYCMPFALLARKTI